MDNPRWLKVSGWVLALVGVVVISLWLVQCPDTAASPGVESSLSPQANTFEGAPKASAGIPDWNWEWQEDQDPSMLGRPTYLR
jgi:hypothetical protein